MIDLLIVANAIVQLVFWTAIFYALLECIAFFEVEFLYHKSSATQKTTSVLFGFLIVFAATFQVSWIAFVGALLSVVWSEWMPIVKVD